MSMQQQYLADEQATEAWGVELAQNLSAGTVIALDGDLGAGKTTLVKGLAKGLGVTAAISSPTFALVQEYPSKRGVLAHFDWYRLEEEEELWQLGWEEYLQGNGIVVVEWACKFPQALPQEQLVFWRLEHLEGRQGRAFFAS